LNILGSKLYIFGGQVEGYFFNDLIAFDLNALQNAGNKWEFLMAGQDADDSLMPPPRTNHTVVGYNDKLYLYGFSKSAYTGLYSLTFITDLAVPMVLFGSMTSGHLNPEQTRGCSLTALDTFPLHGRAILQPL
jgi:glycerol uptake facilitator-like aquaporin